MAERGELPDEKFPSDEQLEAWANLSDESATREPFSRIAGGWRRLAAFLRSESLQRALALAEAEQIAAEHGIELRRFGGLSNYEGKLWWMASVPSVEGYGETALEAVQALRAKLETKES